MMQWDSVGLTSKPEPPPGEDGPLSVQPLPVDEATEAAIQDSVKRAVARVGPHPPITAAELTAHLHDLLSARGQRPHLTDANRPDVEHAAGLLLTALGVAPAPDDADR